MIFLKFKKIQSLKFPAADVTVGWEKNSVKIKNGKYQISKYSSKI